MPYAIVIDASLARAAGQSSDRVALACVDALDAVLKYGHSLAMSEKSRDEWLKSRSRHGESYSQYASMYAFQWWASMVSMRRVVWIELDQASEIRQRILESVTEQDKTQVEKDLYLIESAYVSSSRVLSLDDRIRRHFSSLGYAVPEVCTILWLNPTSTPVSSWLERDAPDEAQYRLCVPSR